MGFFIVLAYVPLLITAIVLAIVVSDRIGRFARPEVISGSYVFAAFFLGLLTGCLATRHIATNVWPGPLQDFPDLFKAMGVSLVFPFVLCGTLVLVGEICADLTAKPLLAKQFLWNVGSGAVHATWALPLAMYVLA